MKTCFQILIVAVAVVTLSHSVMAQQAPRMAPSVRQPVPMPQSVQGHNPYLISDTAPRMMPRQSAPAIMPAPSVTTQFVPMTQADGYQFSDMIGTSADCGCGAAQCVECRRGGLRRPGCRSCGNDCGSIACPRCEGDVCRLELDHSMKKKTCFKTEQVSICIPPVRFPWQTSCPPGTSKTKLVTRLKVHEYECPNCAYKWKLDLPQKSESASSMGGLLGSPSSEPAAPTAAPAKGNGDTPATETLDEGTVPKAPVITGALRRWGVGRRR